MTPAASAEPTPRSTGRAAMWFALAAIGQLAVLRMTLAGPVLRYQHLRPLSALLAESPWLLGLVGLQAIVVAAGLVGAARRVRPLRPRTVAQIALALALAVATAATVSPSPLRYLEELALAACLQLVQIGTIVLGVLAAPERMTARTAEWVDRVFGASEDDGLRPSTSWRDPFAWRLAAFSTSAAAVLAIVSYQRHPHVPDELAYLIHARYFAHGLLAMPAPPVPAAFDVDLMSLEPTRWFSPVPPGWPAVLAIGAWFGVPWLVNPVLAGVAVLLLYAFLGELYSRRVARWGTLFLAVSPWFLFLAMSFMTHILSLVCVLLAALGIARARRTGSMAWAFAGGLGVGAQSLIRPLDGLMVGAAMAAWAIGIGGRRLRVPALATLLLGTVLAGAAVFPYNTALAGSPLRFPINVYTDRLYGPNSNAYGFGKDRGLGWAFDPNPGHGPVDALINADLNTFGINTDLFGWGTGSLVLVTLLVATGTVAGADWLMVAFGGVIFTGYFFYYFSGGPDFGARYWFPVIVPLVALSARGLARLERMAGPRAALGIMVMTALALAIFVPWRAVDKYHWYRGMRPDVRELAAAHGFGRDLVLVTGSRFPDFASAAAENPVDLTGPAPVYAWNRSPDVQAALLRAFADRRVWIVEGPSVTHDGFRVAAGPLTPAEAAARGAGGP